MSSQESAGKDITKEEIGLTVATDTNPITSTPNIVELHLVSSYASDLGQDHPMREQKHKHVGIYTTTEGIVQ